MPNLRSNLKIHSCAPPWPPYRYDRNGNTDFLEWQFFKTIARQHICAQLAISMTWTNTYKILWSKASFARYDMLWASASASFLEQKQPRFWTNPDSTSASHKTLSFHIWSVQQRGAATEYSASSRAMPTLVHGLNVSNQTAFGTLVDIHACSRRLSESSDQCCWMSFQDMCPTTLQTVNDRTLLPCSGLRICLSDAVITTQALTMLTKPNPKIRQGWKIIKGRQPFECI